MRNILIVVDMQKDFVTGALASAEAQAILPEVMAKISEYDRAGKEIIFTRDTHGEDYMQTNEGKHLRVRLRMVRIWILKWLESARTSVSCQMPLY